MYYFYRITVVTCRLGQGLTNVTSVEKNWKKKTFGCFWTNSKQLMTKFKQPQQQLSVDLTLETDPLAPYDLIFLFISCDSLEIKNEPLPWILLLNALLSSFCQNTLLHSIFLVPYHRFSSVQSVVIKWKFFTKTSSQHGAKDLKETTLCVAVFLQKIRYPQNILKQHILVRQ